jgi:hypothetical protein
MVNRILATAILILWVAGPAFGDTWYGILSDFTASTITLKERDGTVTYTLSPELRGNTLRGRFGNGGDNEFNEVKRGDKVRIERDSQGEQYICLEIFLCRPEAVGVVTAVGKDTICIKNDSGKETTYKVAKRLLNGKRDLTVPGVHLYPSNFSEVTKGCKIEAFTWKEDGEFVLAGLDVINGKDKEKDKGEERTKDK